MLFATVKGMTIKFLRQQEYVRSKVFETVAGVVSLQVAVGIYQGSRVQNPTGDGLRCILLNSGWFGLLLVPSIQARPMLLKSTGLRGSFYN